MIIESTKYMVPVIFEEYIQIGYWNEFRQKFHPSCIKNVSECFEGLYNYIGNINNQSISNAKIVISDKKNCNKFDSMIGIYPHACYSKEKIIKWPYAKMLF